MGHHHKSNEQVEGNPDTGHGRGLPRRPNQAALDERTRADRSAAGLAAGTLETPETQYQEVLAEIDSEVAQGDLRSSAGQRADRDPFPPTRYEG
ncbi:MULTISPECIES: hypothetical protein [unclassified Streptomyces]|uniref:hypothetical protein n=1 Tax=unclassified Streptomyces TaxID=2593676 RepID=UPI0034013837